MPRQFGRRFASAAVAGVWLYHGAWCKLQSAVRRAAAPGAVVILRSFREPTGKEEARRAAEDRALIWGSIRVERL